MIIIIIIVIIIIIIIIIIMFGVGNAPMSFCVIPVIPRFRVDSG